MLQVLSDQKHSYSLNCCRDCDDYMGAVVTKIPFVHPTDVGKIVQLLRQQALYNTIIGSCLRKHACSGGQDRAVCCGATLYNTSSAALFIELQPNA